MIYFSAELPGEANPAHNRIGGAACSFGDVKGRDIKTNGE